MKWLQNYGFTFVVEADTQEEAETLLWELAKQELGLYLSRHAWLGDVEQTL